MTYQTLTYEVDDRILTLTLNRPDSLNAFTIQMANELIAAFGRASDDDEVGAIIVTGAGRAFCAGMDLSVPGNVFGLDETQRPTPKDMVERLDDPRIAEGVRDPGGRVTLAIHACKKPVIAAINGAAVGIGATMTLAMDIRMVAETAKIGFIFGRLGITPEACSSYFLPRIVGLQQAMEWVLSAELVGAEEAVASRLVRSAHPADRLMDDARALARKFVDAHSPAAVSLTRRLMVRGLDTANPLDTHRADSLAMFYMSIGDGKEGVAAFREKRAAVFTDRASALPDIFGD